MPARNRSSLPPSSWVRNPHYVMDLEPLPFRLQAKVGGQTVLDSRAAQVMYELGHAPVYYVPRAGLNLDLLRRNDHATHCPYKGDASYWDLAVGGRVIENAVWSYEDPYPEMAAIKDLMGIYWGKMEAWFHDDRAVEEPLERPGRVGETNSFAKLYPALASEWDREANKGLQPYEFAADDDSIVSWRSADGEVWEESIKARVSRAQAAAE